MSDPVEEFEFLKVHKRDPKTGAIVNSSPYVLHITPNGSYFERNGKKYGMDYKEIVEPTPVKESNLKANGLK